MKILRFLTNSIFLSIVLMIGFIWIVEPRISKYETSLTDQETYVEGQRIYYHDFDGDGISERIHQGLNTYSKLPFLLVSDINKHFICEWAMFNTWIERSELIIGDCNDNGIDEVYAFTKHGDTIFLNSYEPFGDTMLLHKRQVDIAHQYNGMNDFDIWKGQVIDIDNDGSKEVTFSINSGYSILPRNYYIYSPQKNTLVKSPLSGAQITYQTPSIVDLDADGTLETLLNTYAPSNMGASEIPYNDSCSWLMVLDHQNEFLFKPVANINNPSAVLTAPLIDTKGSLIISYFSSGGVKRRMPIALRSYDINGTALDSARLEDLGMDNSFSALFCLKKGDNYVPYILDNSAHMYPINRDLSLGKKIALGDDIGKLIRVRESQRNELLLWGNNLHKLYLFKDSFKHPIVFDVENSGGKLIFCDVLQPDGSTAYSIQTGDHWYLYTYSISPFFHLRFLIYLAVGLLSFIVLYFIKKVQRDQLIKMQLEEKEVLAWQMTSLNNQLKPHFTLNVLNSIGGLYNSDRDQAGFYFSKYSKLIRQTLIGADKIKVKLEEELDFIRNYIDLERFRYDNSFNYEIICEDEELLEVSIQKMLVHSFVENAVKHGLRHVKEGGLLQIAITEDAESVQVRITDNGIGRAAAAKMPSVSTGKGLQIVDKMVRIYNQLYNTRVSYTIKDMMGEKDQVAGTVVVITLPNK